MEINLFKGFFKTKTFYGEQSHSRVILVCISFFVALGSGSSCNQKASSDSLSSTSQKLNEITSSGSCVAPQDDKEHLANLVEPSSWKKIKKVVLIIFENTEFENALAQPYLAKIARDGALLANYSAITHPSQPNYISIISGSTQRVQSDLNVNVDAPHLGDLLEEKGMSWKVYAEDYPGGCFLGAQSGDYARKHIPFLSFKNIQENSNRCDQVVNASQFQKDLNAGTLPSFSMYIPNLKNDGHNTGVAYATQWLSKAMGPNFENRELLKDTLFIITFDEGITSKNHIYTLFLGAAVQQGKQSEYCYNHFSLLRTVEKVFGLNSLKKNDDLVPWIDDIWETEQ